MTTKPENHQDLIIFRHPADLPDPTPEEMQKIFEKWMGWMSGLKSKGVYHGGERLEDGGRVLRNPHLGPGTDGPFVEGKEVIGGFIIVSASDLAAAVEIASSHSPMILIRTRFLRQPSNSP